MSSERLSVFQQALGPEWRSLSPSLQHAHAHGAVARFAGRARIERGGGALAGLIAWVFGFPEASDDAPVEVVMRRDSRRERWERDFAGRRFHSHLVAAGPMRVRESLFPLTAELALTVDQGGLWLQVARGWLFGLPTPRVMLPKSVAREYEADGLFHFDVAIEAPFGGGLIVRYQGWLAPSEDAPEGGA